MAALDRFSFDLFIERWCWQVVVIDDLQNLTIQSRPELKSLAFSKHNWGHSTFPLAKLELTFVLAHFSLLLLTEAHSSRIHKALNPTVRYSVICFRV